MGGPGDWEGGENIRIYIYIYKWIVKDVGGQMQVPDQFFVYGQA